MATELPGHRANNDPAGWAVHRLSAALGARVEGPDLSKPLAPRAWDRIDQLYAEHHVLVFGDQQLSPQQHVDFGTHFGDPYIHPFLEAVPAHAAILQVLKTEDDIETFGGEYWHADITFSSPPAATSLLLGHEIPAIGGDTLYANQHLAFERLSTSMQQLLEQLRAWHVYPGLSRDTPGAAALHPVVRVHPVTGRKALFVNKAFVTEFDGMTERESAGLLTFLFEHSVAPEFQARISWEPNQLTMWDNRSVQHYAMNDYAGVRRRLERVTVLERAGGGERP